MRWIVVGAGAAGSVIAARLSERPGDEVVVLEAGPDHGARPAPGDVGPYVADRGRLRLETVVRRPGSMPEQYLQGFGLGGSSLVNGGVLDPGPVGALPVEGPWSVGAVGQALLATRADAAPVRLARAGGARVTTADVYLRPGLEREQLVVRVGAEVDRLVLDGRRATGVALTSGEIIGGDRVVLSAGAIRTPTLLLRSGVVVPGLGEGLQDHPACTITLRLRAEAVDPSTPMISVVATDDDHQVLGLDHLPGAPGLGGLTVGLLRVRSVGRVSLPDRDGPPVVELRQLTDQEDHERLCRAVERTIDLIDAPPWRSVVDEAYVDDQGTSVARLAGSAEAISDWVPAHLGGHHHVAGTCADGVVTDGGRVRGYEALFVCDASLFRGVPVGNPFGRVVDLAERTVRSWS